MTNLRPLLLKIAIVATIALAAYFINVEVQTRLGERARAETGLQSLPLDQALAEATKSNKLVLAELSAVWCPSCRALDKTIFADEAVKKRIESAFVFARIEYESPEGEAFMERYNARGFPTLLVLDPSGNVVRRLPNTTDPSAFLDSLTQG